MSAEELSYSQVTSPIRRVLGEHAQIESLTSRVDQDPGSIENVINSFDRAIQGYNAYEKDQLPDDLRFLPLAKVPFPTLPTIRQMYTTKNSFRPFARGLFQMDQLMTRAENKELEPNIGFHIWEGAIEQERIAGGIFQMYGLTVAQSIKDRFNSKEDLYQAKDMLLDALIEAMALNRAKYPEDPVFAIVKNLGWFEAKNAGGEFLFSQTIRDLAA
ncbi:hypothetical protein HGA88_00560 [Candidatus Roizmanbacteria bacterium]|nr:hypothetical protein [Candidatus Roizmanbacteria bacterium]